MEPDKHKKSVSHQHTSRDARVDQLDGSYEGQLNESHQKHGVGVFQSDQYNTYVGEWRNNNLHGRGCIIFRSGRILFGQFNRNKPFGLSIIRTSEKLVCGTIDASKFRLVGIAFEYDYKLSRWRMLHCERNINATPTPECTTVMAEEDRELSRGPPKIMSSEPEMFTFVGKFIVDFESMLTFNGKKLLSKTANKEIFGNCNKDNQPHGLAVSMRDLELEQVGMFDGGKSNGFAYFQKGRIFTSGLYEQGHKHGVFQEMEHNGQSIVGNQYIHGQLISAIDKNTLSAAMRSQRRKYLDRSKNFISLRNVFNFEDLEQPLVKAPDPPVEPVKPIKHYVKKHIIDDDLREQEVDKVHSLYPGSSERSANTRVRRTAAIEDSCLATVRKRMPYLQRLMQLADADEEEEGDGTVAQEQNPFSFRQ